MKYYKNDIFRPDTETDDPHIVFPCGRIETDNHTVIETVPEMSEKAKEFADEINGSVIGSFEKDTDKMCHVSTFCFTKDFIYVSYYANTFLPDENPDYQVARIAYAPVGDYENKTVVDIMAAGDELSGHKVKKVYDTVLMQRDDQPDRIYILWTALADDQYYRLYRILNTETKELGEIGVNRFRAGCVENDFSTSGIKNALASCKTGYRELHVDIGIMQKLSRRTENGIVCYYTGAYSGNFNCIIKSRDLITWEYVAQPDVGKGSFSNDALWENAVYVLGDRVFYFVRQWLPDRKPDGTPIPGCHRNQWGSDYGFLTCYDLISKSWARPVLIGDCQSRSDFIYYRNNLYLFHAPIDRNHIGIVRIDTENIENSSVVLQADMEGSCFYPFVQYDYNREKLYMSYTVDRRHIKISGFDFDRYIQ